MLLNSAVSLLTRKPFSLWSSTGFRIETPTDENLTGWRIELGELQEFGLGRGGTSAKSWGFLSHSILGHFFWGEIKEAAKVWFLRYGNFEGFAQNVLFGLVSYKEPLSGHHLKENDVWFEVMGETTKLYSSLEFGTSKRRTFFVLD